MLFLISSFLSHTSDATVATKLGHNQHPPPGKKGAGSAASGNAGIRAAKIASQAAAAFYANNTSYSHNNSFPNDSRPPISYYRLLINCR
jgi:hypothetical protein